MDHPVKDLVESKEKISDFYKTKQMSVLEDNLGYFYKFSVVLGS